MTEDNLEHEKAKDNIVKPDVIGSIKTPFVGRN